jgi:hypothetical protein
MSFNNAEPSPFLTATVAVSSAEILDLVANPKTLIAAPGAGNLISVTNMTIIYNYGTITYSPSSISIGFSTGTGFGSNSILAQVANAVSSSAPGLSPNLQTDCVNLPLKMLATVNPLLGDGDLVVKLLYRIIAV